MSQPRELYTLQQIDTRLDQAHARLAEIETALNDNTAMKQAKAKLAQAEESLTNATLALRRAEGDVGGQQEKIDKNQKALYGGGKSPKELEDLQMESGALARYLTVLEDKQLEAMIAYEEASSAREAAQANLEAVTEQVAQENSNLTEEQSKLRAGIKDDEILRQNAASEIVPALLADYDNLRSKRRGLAVADVNGHACAACGSTLTAAQAQAARSPSKITNCSSCGRILVAK